MNVCVRLEGGIGDCLLGNRFVPAIKEAHANCKVTAYIDSEGKTFQKELLEYCYGYLYEDIKIIPAKKQKEFWIDCQFGKDNYFGALENVPDDIRKTMESFPRFYDLHIDSLKWTDYKFDWLRYFRFFPKPQQTFSKEKKIVLHLISSTSVGHRMEQWYIDALINKVCLDHPEYQVVAISTQDTFDSYKNINQPNFSIYVGSIKGVVEHIGSSEIMLSTDSGFRYLAYGYGIPTLTFSKHSPQPHTAIPSHLIRWLIFPETCYPLHYDASRISRTVSEIIKDKGTILAPYVDNFEIQCIKRKYIV